MNAPVDVDGERAQRLRRNETIQRSTREPLGALDGAEGGGEGQAPTGASADRSRGETIKFEWLNTAPHALAKRDTKKKKK